MEKKHRSLSDIFIRNVVNYRKDLGYSQEKLSEEAGLSPNTIWKIENGEEFPRIETLEMLAKGLHVEAFRLFVDPENDKILTVNQLSGFIGDLNDKLKQFSESSDEDADKSATYNPTHHTKKY